MNKCVPRTGLVVVWNRGLGHIEPCGTLDMWGYRYPGLGQLCNSSSNDTETILVSLHRAATTRLPPIAKCSWQPMCFQCFFSATMSPGNLTLLKEESVIFTSWVKHWNMCFHVCSLGLPAPGWEKPGDLGIEPEEREVWGGEELQWGRMS